MGRKNVSIVKKYKCLRVIKCQDFYTCLNHNTQFSEETHCVVSKTEKMYGKTKQIGYSGSFSLCEMIRYMPTPKFVPPRNIQDRSRQPSSKKQGVPAPPLGMLRTREVIPHTDAPDAESEKSLQSSTALIFLSFSHLYTQGPWTTSSGSSEN